MERPARKDTLGRKGYNGRVERSHLTDDEEFYLPLILNWNNTDDLLKAAQAWQYVYNVKRPNFGKGMAGLSPFAKLQSLGYNNLNDTFTLFPVALLDVLDPLLPGNDVLSMDMGVTPGLIIVADLQPTNSQFEI